VSDTVEGFVVAVGESALEFRPAPSGTEPTYHLAFSVPGGSIDVTGTQSDPVGRREPTAPVGAADWLAARTPLLEEDGQQQFRYEFLNATAVYATDPAGNVLELLARDGRAGQAEPFGPDSLLDVGEIGVVTDDVRGAATKLGTVFDLPGSPNEDGTFAYLGGDAGAFVLVAPGRPWFPTDQPAAPAPLTVVAEGGEGTVSVPDGPVSVVGIGEG
jgi:hypothetical protein